MSGFSMKNNLLKMIYAHIIKAFAKVVLAIQKWNLTLLQMAIHFEDMLIKH